MAAEIRSRTLEGWEGGREYLVYADDPALTTPSDGDLSPSGIIAPINPLLRSGLDTHPAPQVDIQNAVGAGIFAANGVPPVNGTMYLAGGGFFSPPSTEYSPEGLIRAFTPGRYWLVLTGIAGAGTPTNAHFKFSWAEIY